MAMKGHPHSLKLQHHWNLTIRLFSVISRTLVGGGLTPQQRSSRCILRHQPRGNQQGWVGLDKQFTDFKCSVVKRPSFLYFFPFFFAWRENHSLGRVISPNRKSNICSIILPFCMYDGFVFLPWIRVYYLFEQTELTVQAIKAVPVDIKLLYAMATE